MVNRGGGSRTEFGDGVVDEPLVLREDAAEQVVVAVPGGVLAVVREEAVLTVTTGGSQVEITATVATFGARVARLGNVPLNRAYPPLADAQLTNPHELRGAIAVIARGGVPFVEKARRAQVRRASARACALAPTAFAQPRWWCSGG